MAEKLNLSFVMSGGSYMQVIQSLIKFLFRYPTAQCSKVWGYAQSTLAQAAGEDTHGREGHLFLEQMFMLMVFSHTFQMCL